MRKMQIKGNIPVKLSKLITGWTKKLAAYKRGWKLLVAVFAVGVNLATLACL